MNLLLDTHVWVWSVEDPDRLGNRTKSILRDKNNERWVCSVSALEIARLAWAGDLSFQLPTEEWVARSMVDLRADSLPVTIEIAVEAYRLPGTFHRDPADRQIVACARLHELTLVTADERILAWKHVPVIDARK